MLVKKISLYTLMFLLFLASLVSVRNIETSGHFFPSLKNSDYQNKYLKDLRMFPETSYLKIFFERLPNESTPDYYRELKSFSGQLEDTALVDRLLSAADLQKLMLDEANLASELIYKEDSESSFELDQTLREDEIFSSFFLPRKKTGTFLYLFYSEENWNRKAYSELHNLTAAYTSRKVILFGDHVFEELIVRMGLNDLSVLGIIAICIIILIESLFFRSLRYGLLFSLITIVPAVYVMAFFPLLHIRFSTFLIPVPILTLVLSTTYTLHIVYYTTRRAREPLKKSLRSVFPVVTAAGMTTAIGFVTMLFSSVDEMRYLGVLMTAGVTISLVIAWFALPPLIPVYLKRVSVQNRDTLLPVPGKAVRTGLILLVCIGIFGVLLYEHEYFVLKRTLRENTLQNYMREYRELNGATNQFTVLLDFEEEYGFVSETRYRSLKALEREIEALPYCSGVSSITSFIDWMNGRIEGTEQSMEPKDEIQIGEALEMLHSAGTGISPESLITPDYSAVRIRILIDAGKPAGRQSWKSYLAISEVERDINSLFQQYFPEQQVILLSESLREVESHHAIFRGMIFSLLFFFPTVLLFLYFVFRTWYAAFIAILPSFLSSLFYLGMMGYFGFRFSVTASVSICMLIGVCVDDAVVLVQFFLNHQSRFSASDRALHSVFHEVGSVIIRTTVIIAAGSSVLLFSSYLFLIQTSALMIVSFIISTLLTLFIIPPILVKVRLKKGCSV